MTQIQNDFAVRASVLVVPDGTEPNGDMRFSLQITPVSIDAKTLDADRIDACDWPKYIRRLAASVSVHVADILGDVKIGSATVLRERYRSDVTWSDAAMAGSDALWMRTFGAIIKDLIEIRTPPAQPAVPQAEGA